VKFVVIAVIACLGAKAEVRFNRDVRPILSDKCFACHGPDAKNKNVPLRLDSPEAATADLGGGRRAVAPGKPADSQLIARITTDKKALRMPPSHTGQTLSPEEVRTLTEWVAEGARWETHWSYLKPERPAPPEVAAKAWPKNPIDSFVLARLEREGLAPAPPASREALLRRASLDLTGLPPTVADLDAFLADQSPTAFEKAVDRLLDTPRYAERMTARWLDAARYADSNGYQSDGERDMYRWRDWVLAAYRSNMPFDQFTIEQIAGDLLPNATLHQRIATGFLRNHRGNGEGGIIPEEYLAEYAADRVETMTTVWLGTTMGCARCHNHKYDPFTQKEFYQLFAFFDKIPERGRYFKYGNTPPVVIAPTDEDRLRLAETDVRLAVAEAAWQKVEPQTRLVPAGAVPDGWSSARHRAFHWRATDPRFDGKRAENAGDKIHNIGYFERFTIAARITPIAPDGMILTRAKDETEPDGGWGVGLHEGKLRLYFNARWLDDALHIESVEPLTLNQPHLIAVTYDSTREARGVHLYVDGKAVETNAILDELNQNFTSKEPVRIGGGGGPMPAERSRFQGSIDEVWIYTKDFSPAEVAALGNPDRRQAWLEDFAPADVREAWRQWIDLREKREALLRSFPTVMVMEENQTRKATYVLERGAYDKPGERVDSGTPAVLPPLPAEGPVNRLVLAKWLVSPEHPLTARVTVNRYWQMLFGNGLVKTVEDFGSQGEWPTHPELLDWLAVEFMQSGWDTRHILKTIVMSATYQQDSRAPVDKIQRDPENRLLARGPRVRLSAETVRDQALFVSGLLVEKMGGPSVKPYQPAGLWRELLGTDYVADKGENLYRRSLYTFWRRTVPPPSMMNFDAAGREICVVRESRTNTPLQALNLMNDVQFVEAARFLAERMIREGGSGSDDRLQYGFRLASSRTARPGEMEVLTGALAYHRDRFETDPASAEKLLLQGDRKRDTSIPPAEHAAYAMVASLILNLDEVVTRQ
jgi:hypothetical protein